MQCDTAGRAPEGFVLCVLQDEGVSENEHQLPVAGKIKKHFNTGPKLNSTTAGVSVITVSTDLHPYTHTLHAALHHKICFMCFRSDALDH